MFKCAITKRSSRPGEAPNKVVVATRERKYFHQVFNEETEEWETVQAGVGWEIVKEVNISASGLELWNSLSQEDKDALARTL